MEGDTTPHGHERLTAMNKTNQAYMLQTASIPAQAVNVKNQFKNKQGSILQLKKAYKDYRQNNKRMNNSKGLLLNYKKSASIDTAIPNTTINNFKP